MDGNEDDFSHIAFHLGRLARRLGIDKAPKIARRKLKLCQAQTPKRLEELWLPDARVLDAEERAAAA